jgi:SAM-dependent methyltransferase
MSLPARLEALVRACRGDEDARRLGADIRRQSALFGAARADRRADYMAEASLRRAYLAFFLPQYAAKIALLADELRREGLLALPPRPRVLDVGAGPLTGLFAAWLLGGELGPSVALDMAKKAMDAGRALFEQLAPGQPIRLVEQPAHKRPLPAGPYDLIVVAHVLNEIGDPRRALPVRVGLVRALLGLLAPGGRLLIVEPGTRVHGRALMAVRDELFDNGAVVLSPCRGAPACPLLRTPGDWCHGETRWDRPRAFVELEEASGLKKTELKQSHLLLARPGDARAPREGLRLVGGLMTDERGVERRYGCGRDGLAVLRGDPRLPPEAREPPRHGLLDPITAVVEPPARAGGPGLTPSRDRAARGGPRGAAGRAGRDRATKGRRPR